MKKIAIIGAGLSGMLAAYLISENSEAEVTIIEKGMSFEDRLKDENPNLLSGIGGAGTLFGGKLCLPPASSGVWKKTNYTTQDFSAFSQKCISPFLEENIIVEENQQCSYIKTTSGLYIKQYDSKLVQRRNMHKLVQNLYYEILRKDIRVNINCEFECVKRIKNGFRVQYRNANEEQLTEHYDYLVFASGRFSADKISKWLGDEIEYKLQNPDLGLRFTMGIAESEVFSQIGKDIKIKKKFGDIGVRTFCVCSGGNETIVDFKGMRYYDGHFGDTLTQSVNMGILARSPHIYGFEGAALYCSCLQKYIKSDMSLKDFVNYSSRLVKEVRVYDDIMEGIKSFILLLQKNGILSENLDRYPVGLPSVDKLNPEICVNESFETKCPNLYVIGDATGLSRGFLQSMWSAYCVSGSINYKLKKDEDKMIV